MTNIINQLNAKFDPQGLYLATQGKPLFTQEQQTIIMFDNIKLYTAAEHESEQKILMLATNAAVQYFDVIINMLALSDCSETNKNKWMQALKKSIENI